MILVHPKSSDPQTLPLVLTIAEAQDVLRLGKHSVRALIADGRLPSIRAGRAIRIPRAGVLRLLGEDGDVEGAE